MNELALFYVCEPRSVKSTSPSIALWIDIPRQQTVPSQLVDTPGISSERLRLVVGEDHVQDFLHFHVVVLDVKARACEPTMWCPVEYLLVDIVVLVNPHIFANTGHPVHTATVGWAPPTMRGTQIPAQLVDSLFPDRRLALVSLSLALHDQKLCCSSCSAAIMEHV